MEKGKPEMGYKMGLEVGVPLGRSDRSDFSSASPNMLFQYPHPQTNCHQEVTAHKVPLHQSSRPQSLWQPLAPSVY